MRRSDRAREVAPLGMSDLAELLGAVRAHYLEHFREAIEEHVADLGQKVIPEAPLLDAAGEVVREGTLQLPYRVDLAIVRDAECVESQLVDTPTLLSFDPVEFSWEGGLRVELAAFQWNM